MTPEIAINKLINRHKSNQLKFGKSDYNTETQEIINTLLSLYHENEKHKMIEYKFLRFLNTIEVPTEIIYLPDKWFFKFLDLAKQNYINDHTYSIFINHYRRIESEAKFQRFYWDSIKSMNLDLDSRIKLLESAGLIISMPIEEQIEVYKEVQFIQITQVLYEVTQRVTEDITE